MKQIMKVGESIIIPNFGRFPEQKITCTSITYENEILGDLYFFDNGMHLYTLELLNNIDLWNSRR